MGEARKVLPCADPEDGMDGMSRTRGKRRICASRSTDFTGDTDWASSVESVSSVDGSADSMESAAQVDVGVGESGFQEKAGTALALTPR